MGKSPGKWIKSMLLGKKSLSSKSSKGKSSSDYLKTRDAAVSAKASAFIPASDPVVVLSSVLLEGAGSEGLDFGQRLGAKQPNEAGIVPCSNGDENRYEVTSTGPPEDSEIIRREKAAIKTQAAIRGYLARRELYNLKGIIKIQALMRGRLVRRQAVATLSCVRAIVKFQALVRGGQVRCSSIGNEVRSTCNVVKIKTAGRPDSSEVSTSAVKEQLPENVIAQKLLSSTCSLSPVSYKCTSGESNSAWEWLGRWSGSHFWASYSEAKANIDAESQVKLSGPQRAEKSQGGTKRSSRKTTTAANLGIKSNGPNSNKSNHNMKKSSSQSADKKHDLPQNGLDKKRNATKEAVKKTEVDKGKSRSKMPESSVSRESPKGEVGSIDKLEDKPITVPRQSDVTSEQIPTIDNVAGALTEHSDLSVQVKDKIQVDDTAGTNKLLKPTNRVGVEVPQSSPRTPAFPLNTENHENGVQSAPKLPSYMAPTFAARAKLRAQGSSSPSQDAIDKNFMNRRLSLPATTIGRLSLNSPRAQRPIQGAKAGIKMDISLSSSRDGSVLDKLIKPEWKR